MIKNETTPMQNTKDPSGNLELGEIKFSAILLFCKNIEVMTEFYAEKLGLPLKQCGKTCASFETELGLGLTLRQCTADDENRTRDHIILGFYVNNIEKIREQLIQKGIQVGPIDSRSFGKTTELKDPEGNIVGFEEPAATNNL